MAPRVIENLSESQIDQLHELYQQEWWSAGRTPAEVRRMLEHTDLYIALADENDRVVGFCRVLTDFVFRAMVYDVMVADQWRGKGLGRHLLDHLMRHPRLADVASITLHCRPEMVPFYEKWGFDLRGSESRIMGHRRRPG